MVRIAFFSIIVLLLSFFYSPLSYSGDIESAKNRVTNACLSNQKGKKENRFLSESDLLDFCKCRTDTGFRSVEAIGESRLDGVDGDKLIRREFEVAEEVCIRQGLKDTILKNCNGSLKSTPLTKGMPKDKVDRYCGCVADYANSEIVKRGIKVSTLKPGSEDAFSINSSAEAACTKKAVGEWGWDLKKIYVGNKSTYSDGSPEYVENLVKKLKSDCENDNEQSSVLMRKVLGASTSANLCECGAKRFVKEVSPADIVSKTGNDLSASERIQKSEFVNKLLQCVSTGGISEKDKLIFTVASLCISNSKKNNYKLTDAEVASACSCQVGYVSGKISGYKDAFGDPISENSKMVFSKSRELCFPK